MRRAWLRRNGLHSRVHGTGRNRAGSFGSRWNQILNLNEPAGLTGLLVGFFNCGNRSSHDFGNPLHSCMPWDGLLPLMQSTNHHARAPMESGRAIRTEANAPGRDSSSHPIRVPVPAGIRVLATIFIDITGVCEKVADVTSED
jgi:hypothetical protein